MFKWVEKVTVNKSGKPDYPGVIPLVLVGLGWPNRDKPLWLYVDILTCEVAVGVTWMDGHTDQGIPYWSVGIILLMFRFRLSRTK